MAEIKGEQHGGDMEYPPAGSVAHEILKHDYLQSICPRAYTVAIANTWITHQPALRNDALLEPVSPVIASPCRAYVVAYHIVHG